jgi:hypothetical protein
MNKNFQILYRKRMKYRDALNDFITKRNMACSVKVFLFTNRCTSDCLKNNFKIHIKINVKTALTCLGAVTPSSGRAFLVLAKVTVVKIAN